ncbi:MAG: hypothetical protein IKV76_07485 [Clostridia bacterium]|nr:hypothetical protein [Clostridia bacterium]
MHEDFDIKIFSPVKKTVDSEPVVIADEMKRQVILGNLQKAKLLGKTIADYFHEAAEKEELWNMAKCCNVTELDRNIKDQAIILSVFAAEYYLNISLADAILSTAALTTLYDNLTSALPKLYNELLSSTAFSFYYMNVDRKAADAAVVGETFAMLCGDKNSEELRCYGACVFNTSIEQYKDLTAEIDFAQ